MEFSKSVIDIIKARKSVRSYSDSLLNEAEKIISERSVFIVFRR